MQQTRQYPDEVRQRHIKVVYEEGCFEDNAYYVFNADVTNNVYAIMLRCSISSSNQHYLSLLEKAKEYTMLTSDGVDIRTSVLDLRELINKNDTLRIVKKEEERVPVRSSAALEEFKEYRPYLNFSSEDLPPSKFVPTPLFCSNQKVSSEVFGASTDETVTPIKEQRIKPRMTTESFIMTNLEDAPFFEAGKFTDGNCKREQSFNCDAAN